MRRRLLFALGVAVLAAPGRADQAPAIDHQPVRCVVAERFPRLDARFVPAGAVAKARVLFLAQDGTHWYAVGMKPEGPGFSGVLPKPKKSLKTFRYYIEVVDKAAAMGRTEEYTTSVVATAGGCQDGTVASGLGSASVAVEVPPGAPAVPTGFSASGVAAVAGVAGAAAATGAATGAVAGASAGGGIPTAVVIGVAGAAAAGAAVAVAASRGDDAPSAAAGNYRLEQVDGMPLPTVVVGSPCVGSATAGTLTLSGDRPNYALSQTTTFQCINGPGPTNVHTETGQWTEAGSSIRFTPEGPNVFNLAAGTLSGTTLTMSMDMPSGGAGIASRRVVAIWRNQ